jgi:hypothetical protein
MKLSEAVREIIRLVDASRAYWDRELPKRHPRYPIIRAGEDSGPPPPEDAQIRALLERLPEDQLYALILLVYVGSGDFSADHLPSAYQTMKEMFPSKDLAIAQITGTYALAEYLTDAMEESQKRKIDLDSLKFTSTAGVS